MKKRNPKSRGYIRICPACSVTVDPVFYGWHKMKCPSVVENLNSKIQKRSLQVSTSVPANLVTSSSPVFEAKKYPLSGDGSKSEPEKVFNQQEDVMTQPRVVLDQDKQMSQLKVAKSVNSSQVEGLQNLERHAEERFSMENDNVAIVSEGSIQTNDSAMPGICTQRLNSQGKIINNSIEKIGTPSLASEEVVVNSDHIHGGLNLKPNAEVMNHGMSGASSLDRDAEGINHVISSISHMGAEEEIVSLGLDSQRDTKEIGHVLSESPINGVREKNNHVLASSSSLPFQQTENVRFHVKVEPETEVNVFDMSVYSTGGTREEPSNNLADSNLPSHQTDIRVKVEPENTTQSPTAVIREECHTVQSLKAELREKDKIIETLRSELAEKCTMAESLKSELIDRNGLVEYLRMEVMEKNKTLNALQAELRQKQQSLDNAKLEQDIMRSQLKEKTESVEKLGSEFTAMHAVIEKLGLKNNTIDSTSTPNELEQANGSLENREKLIRQCTGLDLVNRQTNLNCMSQHCQEGKTTARETCFNKNVDLDRIVDLACGEEQISNEFLSQIDELVVSSTPQDQQGAIFSSMNNFRCANINADASVHGNISGCTTLSLEAPCIPNEIQQQNHVCHRISESTNDLAAELKTPVGNNENNINHNVETNEMSEDSSDETTALVARKLKRRTCQTIVSTDSGSDFDGFKENASRVPNGSTKHKRLRKLSRKNHSNTSDLHDDIISTPIDWVMDIEEPETPRSASNLCSQEGFQNKRNGKSVRVQRRLFVDSESSGASQDRNPNEENATAVQGDGGSGPTCSKSWRLRSSVRTRQNHDQISVPQNQNSDPDSICGKRTRRISTRAQRRLMEGSGSDTDSYEGDSLDGFIVEDSDDITEISGSSGEDDMSICPESSLCEPWVSVNMIKNLKAKNYAWEHEGQMLSSLDSDKTLCLRALCALNRRQTEDEQRSKASMYSNKRGFDKLNAPRATSIAEFLTDGETFGPLKKSVEDLVKHDPNALNYCKMLSFKHSKQLFDIYQNEEDPYFPCG